MTTSGSPASVLIVFVCLLPLVLSALAAHAEEAWHNPAEFDLEGKGWTDTEAPYDRLPAHANGKAPQDVWDLSKDSAGMCVRFQTDSPMIAVRWSLTNINLALPHMPATGVSGVDLYRRTADGGWRFVQNGRPASAQENSLSVTTGDTSGQIEEYLLYLPLYNGVRSLEIGVAPGAHIGKAAPRPTPRNRPVVFYGTSITQGGCASRPGMAYTALLGRRLDWPVINLGFSGSGRMEPVMATLLSELDPALFVIDCLANMGDLPEDEIARRIANLAHTLRHAHPDTPILFVAQSSIHPERLPTRLSGIQEKTVKQLTAEGVSGLFLASGKNLLGTDGEATVDGGHPTDLGMMRMADALYPALRDILNKNAAASSAAK
jgi:lysophospholipase L1-like esterase